MIDELSQPSSRRVVAERNDITKRKVELIMKRAVKRGKKRKKLEPQKDIPEHVAIDEVALTGGGFGASYSDLQLRLKTKFVMAIKHRAT